jgi:hypothetical protein
MGCSCGKSQVEIDLKASLVAVKAADERQVWSETPSRFAFLERKRPSLDIPTESLCIFSRVILNLKEILKEAKVMIDKGKGKSETFQELYNEANSFIHRFNNSFQRDMQLVVAATNRARCEEASEIIVIALLDVLWSTKAYGLHHSSRVNCIIVLLTVSQNLIGKFVQGTSTEFISTLETSEEMKSVNVKIKNFMLLTECCCQWIQFGTQINAITVHFMTFQQFNDNFSKMTSFIDARIRLALMLSDSFLTPDGSTSTHVKKFREVNANIDRYKSLSNSVAHDPLLEKAYKMKEQFSINALKMEHKLIKEMYQEVNSFSEDKCHKVIKKCGYLLTEFAELHSLPKNNPMLIEIQELCSKLIQFATKQVLCILPQRDEYSYDIDKNVYLKLLDRAAHAWKDSLRKVMKYKNENNDHVFKKFDKDTKFALRDILKYSQNYNDLDMLDHTILFVINLGLPKDDELVQEAIEAKQKVAFSQIKKAIKQCQSSLEKNKDNPGFFTSLAYLEDKDNLVLAWDSKTRLNSDEATKFIGVLGEYEPNGSYGRKVAYYHPNGSMIQYRRANGGKWILKDKKGNVVAEAKPPYRGAERPPFNNWYYNSNELKDMVVDKDGWVLILAYNHKRGTNPSLVPNKFPTSPDTGKLGGSNFSHNYVNKIKGAKQSDIMEVRFYARTSHHNRIIHFKTSHPKVKRIAWDGHRVGYDASWFNRDFTTLAGHTAHLPGAAQPFKHKPPGGLTDHLFYKASNYHWNIAANGRWEVDDYGGNHNTLHEVWVKLKGVGTGSNTLLNNKLMIKKKRIDINIYSNGAIKCYNDLVESLKVADDFGISKNDQVRGQVEDSLHDIGRFAIKQFMEEASTVIDDDESDIEGKKRDYGDKDVSCHKLLEKSKAIISYAKLVSMPKKSMILNGVHIDKVVSKVAMKIISSVLDNCNDFVIAAGDDGLESVITLELGERKAFLEGEKKEDEEGKQNGEWLEYKGFEYRFIEQRMNYNGHNNNAKKFKAHMVSITSEGEYMFVREKVSKRREILLGCHRIGLGNGKGPRHWGWNDGSKWTVEKWNPGEPNNWGGVENRVQQYAHNGLWNDIHHNHATHSVYKRKAGKKKHAFQNDGKGGSTPALKETGRFDTYTINALKKYLFFCGENPGKINGKFDGVAEQALITFLAKVNCFGFGSVFDCLVQFFWNQGFDVSNASKNNNDKYTSQMFGFKKCFIPSKLLQGFLKSEAASINPVTPKQLLQCTLKAGENDIYDLFTDNGLYYPMGMQDGKNIWRTNNFSTFQYVKTEKRWNWMNWEDIVICSVKSSNNYPPIYGWQNVQKDGPADSVSFQYIHMEEAKTEKEFKKRSIVTRLFDTIEHTKRTIDKYDAKLTKAEKERFRNVKLAIVEVVLRVAADSGDKHILNGALQLATKEKLSHYKESKDLEKAKKMKIALDVGAEMMQLKKQPTISVSTIKNLTSPENLELELRRREYLKHGGSIDCPLCKGDKKINATCWMCLGSGKTSKAIAELEAPDLDDLNCMICWEPAEFGLSTVCTHFYCSYCIKQHLETSLEMGQIPIYCPACKATHGSKKGKKPKVGRVEESVLTFLERRNVIDTDTQFRIMIAERRKRDASEQGKEFFACPAKCGNYLIHEDTKSGTMQIVQGKNGPKMVFNLKKPGVCKCGTLVCVKCHIKLDENSWKKHKCNEGGGGAKMDAKTLATLRKNAKQCPNCQGWVQKSDGCDTMMCGTNSHGSILQAIRNGGCGHQFYWSSLKPASTFYTGINGERRNGLISKEYRLQAIERVFGEQKK